MATRGKYITCPICGKEFYVEPYRDGRTKYCSKACLGIANGNRFRGIVLIAKIKRLCKICQKIFFVYPSRLKKDKCYCCSRTCADKWHAQQLTGKKASIETKRKIAESKKGKVRWDLIKHWEKYWQTKLGKDRPLPRKQPMLIEYQCAWCGLIWPGRKRGGAKKDQRHFCCKLHHSKWRQQRYAGKNNPMYGITLFSKDKHPNWKGGSIKYTCYFCGKSFQRRRNVSYIANRHFCSKGCYHHWCSGENNYAWNGGTSFEPYGIEFNNKLKNAIRKRDHYRCQHCGKYVNDKALAVHHINYVKTDNRPENLIALCDKCHIKTNFDREKWQAYFADKTNQLKQLEQFAY